MVEERDRRALCKPSRTREEPEVWWIVDCKCTVGCLFFFGNISKSKHGEERLAKQRRGTEEMRGRNAVTESRCWDQEKQRPLLICPGTCCLVEVGAHRRDCYCWRCQSKREREKSPPISSLLPVSPIGQIYLKAFGKGVLQGRTGSG